MLDIRSPYNLLRNLVEAQQLEVFDPLIVTAASPGVVSEDKRWAIRSLENCGTNAVYWRVGGIPSAGSFHGILKGSVAADDGSGGFVDLSRFRGPVYLASVDGAAMRVVVFQALGPEGQS